MARPDKDVPVAVAAHPHYEALAAAINAAAKNREAFMDDECADPVEEAQEAVRNAPCSCDELRALGWLAQCERHHGVGCYCLACVA